AVTAEEARSGELERAFEENERERGELAAQLDERLGELKELFGVLQQVTEETRGQFDASLTQVQYPERRAFLDDLGEKLRRGSRLASLEEIERLWFELQREMVASGKIEQVNLSVLDADGSASQRRVTRVGLFNLVTDGKYLAYAPATGQVSVLPRQPPARYLATLDDFSQATSGLVPFGIDPTRGQLLSLMVQAPSLVERIDQGGAVGYLIMGLGVVALLIALERLAVLIVTGLRVRAQARRPEQPGDNPLGRVLRVYHDNPYADVETLELKLGEAILKELPRLNRALTLLKVIAVVAPLLGLLGTVIGMILTFQAITLFGTGDPKVMAGGISQALVTTVQGLAVAIPTLLLHTLVTSPARRLGQVLEEQAAGLVARQAERLHAGAPGEANA
ncbi:MAG: energy transducer TonB, partial [Gammaproteobacteria bacterium]|nr:energy transducer TonB [Gammaproteobacteria bacterium]